MEIFLRSSLLHVKGVFLSLLVLIGLLLLTVLGLIAG